MTMSMKMINTSKNAIILTITEQEEIEEIKQRTKSKKK